MVRARFFAEWSFHFFLAKLAPGQPQGHVTPLVALPLMKVVLSKGFFDRGVCDDLLGHFRRFCH